MGETVLYEGHSIVEDGLRVPTVFLGALGHLLGLWDIEYVEIDDENRKKISKEYSNGWLSAGVRISNVKKPSIRRRERRPFPYPGYPGPAYPGYPYAYGYGEAYPYVSYPYTSYPYSRYIPRNNGYSEDEIIVPDLPALSDIEETYSRISNFLNS